MPELSTGSRQAWRAETVVSFASFGDEISGGLGDWTGGKYCFITIGGTYSNANPPGAIETALKIARGEATADATTTSINIRADQIRASLITLFSGDWTPKVITTPLSQPGKHSLAVEGRDRWVYYYIDQTLVGVMPMPSGSYSDGRAFAQIIEVNGAAGLSTNYLDVHLLAMRKTEPFLARGATVGDYQIGGAPVPGGLIGSYYNDADLAVTATGSADPNREGLILNPTRTPYARRQDSEINFDSGLSQNWQPLGLMNDGQNFSAMWTGSVYLDLAASDWTIRVAVDTGYLADTGHFRMYVGKTLGDVALLGGNSGTLTSSSLRTWLGSQKSGWYPVRIEWGIGLNAHYFTVDVSDVDGPDILFDTGSFEPTLGVGESVATAGAKLVMEWSSNGVDYGVVPSNSLSPFGIYDSNVRFESHYDQVRSVAETFALQFTCVPKQLESGLFPGEIAPYTRVGRDTEKILDLVEATEISVDLNAEEVADALLADAAGIADPTQNNQLTAEVFDSLEAERHLFLNSEYDSLSDIAYAPLLQQRLTSLILLRGSAWEQVQARPAGFRELLDAFPLTGNLAEFAWEPGDGIRINLPVIGVEDHSARQILGVQRDFVPDGLGRPTVAFRQRPRSFGEMIRNILRDHLQSQRNYQGTLAVVTGTLGGAGPGQILFPSAIRGTGAANDAYSRVNLPNDISSVVSGTFVVQEKNDTSSWEIEINGAGLGIIFSVPGRYDITAAARQSFAGRPQMFGRATGGTGGVLYAIELVIRI